MAPHVVLKYSSTENMAASSGAVFLFPDVSQHQNKSVIFIAILPNVTFSANYRNHYIFNISILQYSFV